MHCELKRRQVLDHPCLSGAGTGAGYELRDDFKASLLDRSAMAGCLDAPVLLAGGSMGVDLLGRTLFGMDSARQRHFYRDGALK